MAARTAKIQKYNQLVRSKVSDFRESHSKTLMGVSIAVLDLFSLNDEGNLDMPENSEVKQFFKHVLPSSSQLFTDEFCKIRTLPIILLKDIANIYDCGTPDASFMRNIHLTTEEDLSLKIKAIVWLCGLMSDSASFTRSFIDRYIDKTDVNRGNINLPPNFTTSNSSPSPMAPSSSLFPRPPAPNTSEPPTMTPLTTVPPTHPSTNAPREHRVRKENLPGQYGDFRLENRHGHYHVSIPSRGGGTEHEPFYGLQRRVPDEGDSQKVNYSNQLLVRKPSSAVTSNSPFL